MKDHFLPRVTSQQPTPLGGRAVGGQGTASGVRGAQSVAITNGFYAGLAPRQAQFFARQYSGAFPHDIGLWTSPSGLTTLTEQRTVKLGAFDIAPQTILVIKNVRFRVFQDNGLGMGLSEVPPGALAGFVSFDFKVSGQSLVNMSNNAGQGSFGVSGAPTNVSEIPVSSTSLPPTSTQQQLDENGGNYSERFGQDGRFNLYGYPGQKVEAGYQVIQFPDINVKSVGFELTGYTCPDTVLKSILGFDP